MGRLNIQNVPKFDVPQIVHSFVSTRKRERAFTRIIIKKYSPFGNMHFDIYQQFDSNKVWKKLLCIKSTYNRNHHHSLITAILSILCT